MATHQSKSVGNNVSTQGHEILASLEMYHQHGVNSLNELHAGLFHVLAAYDGQRSHDLAHGGQCVILGLRSHWQFNLNQMQQLKGLQLIYLGQYGVHIASAGCHRILVICAGAAHQTL